MPLQIELLEGKKNVGAHEHVDALPGGPQLACNVPAVGNGPVSFVSEQTVGKTKQKKSTKRRPLFFTCAAMHSRAATIAAKPFRSHSSQADSRNRIADRTIDRRTQVIGLASPDVFSALVT